MDRRKPPGADEQLPCSASPERDAASAWGRSAPCSAVVLPAPVHHGQRPASATSRTRRTDATTVGERLVESTDRSPRTPTNSSGPLSGAPGANCPKWMAEHIRRFVKPGSPLPPPCPRASHGRDRVILHTSCRWVSWPMPLGTRTAITYSERRGQPGGASEVACSANTSARY